MIADFALARVTSLRAALEEVARGGTPYCGGTELVAAMQLGLLAPESLVDLKRVPELSGVADTGTTITIGATTRHRAVAADPLVGRDAAVLRTACSELGNQRVRATGSIGGNLCFAEPRSDVMTALLALGAEVVLRSLDGERVLSLDDFALGAMETDREEDELLVAVRVPRTPGRQVHLRFQPAEYPTACVALVATGRTAAAVRLVVGAVGERPHVVDAGSVDDLDPVGIAAELDVTADLNGAEDYKRHIAAVFIRRAAAEWRGSNDGK